MGVEADVRDTIQTVAAWLQDMLPGPLQSFVSLARRTLEYASSLALDHGGRYPWQGLIAALLIAAGAYYFSRKRANSNEDGGFLRFCFPREIYRGKSAWVDLKIGFFNYVLFGGGAVNLTWRLSTALFASWVTFLLVAVFGPVEHDTTMGPLAIILFAIALSMASDFGYFLFHWTAHVFPPLWAIHKLHHSAEVMTPLTAARVHAFERPIMAPCMALSMGVLVGPALYLHSGAIEFPTILGLDLVGTAFFAVGHVLQHSHVWVYFGPIIGRLIVSPAQHQIHHSCLPQHLDKNFAEHWAFWDAIFGTLYLPQGRETLKLGLAGYQEQPHTGVLTANLRPVVESVSAWLAVGRWLIARAAADTARDNALPVVLVAERTADPG